MGTTMETLFTAAGPVGILAYILWHVFNRLVDTHEKHNAALVESFQREMTADREALRQEFAELRREHREELQGIRKEIHELRTEGEH